MTDEYLTGPNGTYRLLQRIGTGGMGVVHLALDPDGRTVAVKELHPTLIDEDMLRRLDREVTSMRSVTSPYVAEIVDADVQGERPFIATRYVQGRALDSTVRDRGTLDGDRLLGLASGLADALTAIHEAGIIHRDLKPSNVMLTDDRPVVIDFGIAQAIDATRLTHTGVVVGTPGYVAPEVVNGDVADQPADIFAWAATIAYAATGRSPFGTGPAEVIFFRIAGAQADLHGVKAPLLPVLRSALARDPGARPTAPELARRLAELEGASLVEPPPTQTSAAGDVPAGPAVTGTGSAGAAEPDVAEERAPDAVDTTAPDPEEVAEPSGTGPAGIGPDSGQPDPPERGGASVPPVPDFAPPEPVVPEPGGSVPPGPETSSPGQGPAAPVRPASAERAPSATGGPEPEGAGDRPQPVRPAPTPPQSGPPGSGAPGSVPPRAVPSQASGSGARGVAPGAPNPGAGGAQPGSVGGRAQQPPAGSPPGAAPGPGYRAPQPPQPAAPGAAGRQGPSGPQGAWPAGWSPGGSGPQQPGQRAAPPSAPGGSGPQQQAPPPAVRAAGPGAAWPPPDHRAGGVVGGSSAPGSTSEPRLGFPFGALLVVALTGLSFVLPTIGILLAFVALVVLGAVDRIRSAAVQVAFGRALWRVALAFGCAGAVAWLLELLLESLARPKFEAGEWDALAGLSTLTVLAFFVAATVLVASGVPRWRSPSRALARLVAGPHSIAPVLRYALMVLCVLLIIAALIVPAPSWLPLPLMASTTFSDALL